METTFFQNLRKNFKSNSTATILIKHFLHNPNIHSVIKAISNLIFEIIYENNQIESKIEQDLELFSDEYYINRNPNDFSKETLKFIRDYPTLDSIELFLADLVERLNCEVECLIIGYIYFNRFIANKEIIVKPVTFRPLLVVSLVLAHKIWGPNNDTEYEYLYMIFESFDLKRLENKFLESIDYKTDIKFSTFSRYFFELKELSPDELLAKPFEILEYYKQTDNLSASQKSISEIIHRKTY